ncbi:MAG: hemerythrin domain-containing protein [Kiloniellales bacterium]|nr:hemerythrin domain-containing protein [Kiloniellales bacterium]
MSEATKAIRQDHRNMWALLDAVEEEFSQFKQGHSPDYELLASALRYCMHYPELYHHPKEDVIFSKLCSRDPELARIVGDLDAEHEALREITRRMAVTISRISHEAEVPRPAVAELMDSFIESYREHMRMEEDRFLPAAESRLTPGDWVEVEAEIEDLYDPLKDARITGYKDLRSMVVSWGSDNKAAAG